MRILLARPKLVALLAGFLSATGFAPYNLWPVTLACLIALILVIEDAPDRRAAFLRGWLFGVGHFTCGLNWIAHAFTFQDSMPHWFGYGAVILLSLYLAVFPGFATLGAWWLCNSSPLRGGGPPRSGGGGVPTYREDDTPPSSLRDATSPCRGGSAFLPLPLFLAATWLATEYLRATLFTGFAWNPLGAILLPTGMAIGATLIGTYGLGALTILAAGAILLALRRQVRPAAAILAPLAALVLWGLLAPAPATPSGAPRVRIVQPNIGQDEKYSVEAEYRNFRKLTALSGQPRPAPRLIFWPEAAIPAYLDMEPDWRARLAGLLGPGDLLLTGGDKVYFKPVEQDGVLVNKLVGANNSVWIVTPRATMLGRYDKAHLVPYGEYLPMRGILEPIGLSRLVPGDADFWPGPGPQSLTLPATLGRPALKMGVQICYEIIFSGHVIDAANRPDFLFNPSNDAWFGNWGPVQHLAQARLRAIEEGIPIIRATPTGVSAIIDARGQVVHALGLHRAGFLDAGLPPALPPTLFARLGNWAPLALMLLLLGAALALRKGKS
ncbi:apolipoprotein N-acyltransferase [Sphingobium sp. HBC34]|uniref:Apolipoprotein N-acyltransferase n=1 Tax=Sphingobium cyanobacteriorum TaxID=3063954 RepID=A0ABT8ZNZ5_9SPHN|nr:apolipoprotein N-acyltransferase [Sphingobium sp. HBC34]MDO7836254.1 apolipoprotein N-acyltransferase [Sphingobium sp. HBC34]